MFSHLDFLRKSAIPFFFLIWFWVFMTAGYVKFHKIFSRYILSPSTSETILGERGSSGANEYMEIKAFP